MDWLEAFGIQFGVVNQLDYVNKRINDIVSRFPEVFNERIGKFTLAKIKLYLKSNATPIFRKARTVPLAFKQGVTEELERLEKEGIISKTETSEWATPLVPVLKENGTVRLCGDYSVTVNKYLENMEYPLPRAEEIFSKIHTGKYYTKLDLCRAYNQFEVDKESSKILTWSTHKGLYTVNRLPFGIKVASFIFQRYLEQLLKYIPSCVCYLDDIILTGENEEEHLKTLILVLEQLKKAGLTVKLDKCEFFKSEVEYLGHVIGRDGLKTSEKKIQAIKDAPRPENLTEV